MVEVYLTDCERHAYALGRMALEKEQLERRVASLELALEECNRQARRGTNLIADRTWRQIEEDVILESLRHHNGNKTKAAAALQISLRKIQYTVKRLRDDGDARVRRLLKEQD